MTAGREATGRCLGCCHPSGSTCGGCGAFVNDGWDGKTAGREATVRWATGWYMRKRHIVNEERTTSAICSDYTGLYPEGRESGAKWNVPIPPADSPEVMALPSCGLCTRKVKR